MPFLNIGVQSSTVASAHGLQEVAEMKMVASAALELTNLVAVEVERRAAVITGHHHVSFAAFENHSNMNAAAALAT